MNLEVYAAKHGFTVRLAGDTPQGFKALEKHLSLAELHDFVEALYRAEGAFYDGAGYEYSTSLKGDPDWHDAEVIEVAGRRYGRDNSTGNNHWYLINSNLHQWRWFTHDELAAKGEVKILIDAAGRVICLHEED